MLIFYAWYTALTVTIMQYANFDRPFTGHQRLARFASPLDDWLSGTVPVLMALSF